MHTLWGTAAQRYFVGGGGLSNSVLKADGIKVYLNKDVANAQLITLWFNRRNVKLLKVYSYKVKAVEQK